MLSTLTPVRGQISPGALSHAHRSITGLANCTRCHELSTGRRTFRCMNCHQEIAQRVAGNRGLHATYDIKPGSSEKCVNCHSEHNGEDSPLTKWNIAVFDHDKTGYKLEGKHVGLSCNRCHSSQHVSRDELATIRMTDLSKTFLGVSQQCTTCHRDQHKGRLGADCLQCHNFVEWKTLDIKEFNHSLARYPLTGLHGKVSCAKCHGPGPEQAARYVGIPFSDCGDCHADPHHGGFPQACRSCHDTDSWSKTSSAEMNRTFDHSRTKFPLLGKHRAVECVQCHAAGDFRKHLAFDKCSDCHHPDPHGGQFAKRAGGSECSNCHSLDAFKPSTFGLKEHAATAYPLEGKHSALQCAQCHIARGKATIYKMKFRSCTDCHADQHEGQFASSPHVGRCEDCHNVQRFLPSTFGLRRHNESSFHLNGSHVAVPCLDCHKQSSMFAPKPTAQYHWPGLSCRSCHADPHAGRFDGFLRSRGPRQLAGGCELCHSAVLWNDLSPFDHSKTSFPLTGAHKSTKCADCHRAQNPRTGLMQVDFKLAPARCGACHEEVHGSQFSGFGGGECSGCHDTSRWKPSRFDHDKQSSFALEGAHRNVRCESCHKLTRMVDRKLVLFYKPTPKECVACHGRDVRRAGQAAH